MGTSLAGGLAHDGRRATESAGDPAKCTDVSGCRSNTSDHSLRRAPVTVHVKPPALLRVYETSGGLKHFLG